VLSEWEEDNERKRKWYTFEKAVKKVSTKQLSDILKTLPEFINHTAE